MISEKFLNYDVIVVPDNDNIYIYNLRIRIFIFKRFPPRHRFLYEQKSRILHVVNTKLKKPMCGLETADFQMLTRFDSHRVKINSY